MSAVFLDLANYKHMHWLIYHGDGVYMPAIFEHTGYELEGLHSYRYVPNYDCSRIFKARRQHVINSTK